jgi:hypothetical protein
VLPPVIAAVGDQQRPPGPDPAPSRLSAFICVLALYLAFAGALIAFGYSLWAALAGATTACVVAGEVACRIITADATPTAMRRSGLPDLLRDVSTILDRGSAPQDPGGRQREI